MTLCAPPAQVVECGQVPHVPGPPAVPQEVIRPAGPRRAAYLDQTPDHVPSDQHRPAPRGVIAGRSDASRILAPVHRIPMITSLLITPPFITSSSSLRHPSSSSLRHPSSFHLGHVPHADAPPEATSAISAGSALGPGQTRGGPWSNGGWGPHVPAGAAPRHVLLPPPPRRPSDSRPPRRRPRRCWPKLVPAVSQPS